MLAVSHNRRRLGVCVGERGHRSTSNNDGGSVDDLFVMMGIESWKPVLTALLLPPVPLLLGVLVGARLMLPRRGWGWLVILLSVTGLWLSACVGTSRLIDTFVLKVPSALSRERLAELKAEVRAQARNGDSLAIVVLGGGREGQAPEYGVSNLTWPSLERLRYGLWLSREIGAPVAFTGGVGWGQGQQGGTAEAEIAQRIATQDFNRPLRWVETRARDTRENALRTLPMLRTAGVTHVLLVTHGWHMPRALHAFQQANLQNQATGTGAALRIEAAPMGLATRVELPALDWIPTTLGFTKVRQALRELLARMGGG